DRLREALMRLGSQGVTKAARLMGERSLQLAKRGAEAGRNPQGRAWRKLKRTGGVALLGAASALHATIRSKGFDLTASQPWLRFQQAGAGKRGAKWRLPKRRILPAKSLPKQWLHDLVFAVSRDFE